MLSSLANDQIFATSSVTLQGNLDRLGRFPGVQTVTDPAVGTALSYKSSDRSYTLPVTDPVDNLGDFSAVFTPADIVSAQTSGRYSGYQRSVAVNSTDTRKLTLKLFNPGTGNDQLMLNYASAALFSLEYSNAAMYAQEYRSIAYFSQKTPAASVPMSGTATYSGVILGEAYPSQTPALTSRYDLTGTFKIVIDFGARTYTGSLSITGTDPSGGVLDLGTFSIVQGSVPGSIAAFDGKVQGGALIGALAGPNAEELGISFQFLSTAHVGTNFYGITIAASGAAKR